MKSDEGIMCAYDALMSSYGPQGWWPLANKIGYHIGDHSYPKTKKQRYEICIGAILTQNTSWKNVEVALASLKKATDLEPVRVIAMPMKELAKTIRSAGYFNQKAKKLAGFTKFFLDLGKRAPKRDELLDLWGIGPETADSMLCYGWKIPEFVIDAYTKRVSERMGWVDRGGGYDELKVIFTDAVGPDIIVQNELHALIVAHCKRSCRKKPICEDCVISSFCEKRI